MNKDGKQIAASLLPASTNHVKTNHFLVHRFSKAGAIFHLCFRSDLSRL